MRGAREGDAAVGFAPQRGELDPLHPFLTEEVVAMGLVGRGRRSRAERRALVAEALATAGMAARAEVRFRELSGGQRQRALVARALVAKPELVVLDGSPCRVPLASGRTLAHIDGPHFLATKLAGFHSRGAGDYLASEDLEDVVVVVERRSGLEAELSASSSELRGFVARGLDELLGEAHFVEALPGYFVGEPFDGARVRALMGRLRRMAVTPEGGGDS